MQMTQDGMQSICEYASDCYAKGMVTNHFHCLTGQYGYEDICSSYIHSFEKLHSQSLLDIL